MAKRKKLSTARPDKTCYCHTCQKAFHYLGIARHRRAHLERGEKVVITYTYGDTYIHG